MSADEFEALSAAAQAMRHELDRVPACNERQHMKTAGSDWMRSLGQHASVNTEALPEEASLAAQLQSAQKELHEMRQRCADLEKTDMDDTLMNLVEDFLDFCGFEATCDALRAERSVCEKCYQDRDDINALSKAIGAAIARKDHFTFETLWHRLPCRARRGAALEKARSAVEQSFGTEELPVALISNVRRLIEQLNTPKLSVLYRQYSQWQSALQDSIQKTEQKLATVRDATAELLCMSALLLSDHHPAFRKRFKQLHQSLAHSHLFDIPAAKDQDGCWFPPPLDVGALRDYCRCKCKSDDMAPVLVALTHRLCHTCDVAYVVTVDQVRASNVVHSCIELLQSAMHHEQAAVGDATPDKTARIAAALICRLAARLEGRQYLLSLIVEPPDGPLGAMPKADIPNWPPPDVVTLMLNRLHRDKSSATAAYCALALQRLSLERLATRRLIYVGALPVLLDIAKMPTLSDQLGFISASAAATVLNCLWFREEVQEDTTSLPLGWVAGGSPLYFYCYATEESAWHPPKANPPLLVEIIDAFNALRGRDTCFARITAKRMLEALYALGQPLDATKLEQALNDECARRSQLLPHFVAELELLMTPPARKALPDQPTTACDTTGIEILWPGADRLDEGVDISDARSNSELAPAPASATQHHPRRQRENCEPFLEPFYILPAPRVQNESTPQVERPR